MGIHLPTKKSLRGFNSSQLRKKLITKKHIKYENLKN